MSFNLAHIWSTMSPVNKFITASLFLMAVLVVGVAVERLIAFYRSANESRIFAQKAAPLLEEWKLEELSALAQKHKASALARLFGSTVDRYVRADEDLAGGMTPVEMARNEAARRQEAIGAELRRGFGIVASIGSVAPFVGLLGTVIGIIMAFQGIAATGSGGLAAVSAGIAEALVETAFGLMVAIPAVLVYNYLSTRVATVELALGRSAGELLDEMENHYGRQADQREKHAA